MEAGSWELFFQVSENKVDIFDPRPTQKSGFSQIRHQTPKTISKRSRRSKTTKQRVGGRSRLCLRPPGVPTTHLDSRGTPPGRDIRHRPPTNPRSLVGTHIKGIDEPLREVIRTNCTTTSAAFWLATSNRKPCLARDPGCPCRPGRPGRTSPTWGGGSSGNVSCYVGYTSTSIFRVF